MRKVRITRLPNMAYGGKVFNQVAPNALPDKTSEPKHKVKKVLEPVSRENANIEAEKGETAFILNKDGLPAHYKIGGKRHTNGGTPLNVPEDTFIFSDTKSMTIKDLKILSQFGEVKPKTPAKIAEKYDLNRYRKVLSDKHTDDLQRQTAEKMIENYTMLLGKLALVQESMKGFPQGIPMISQPYMIMNALSPEDILPQPDQKLEQQMQQGNPEEMMEGPMSNPQEEMMEGMPPEGMGQEMMPQQQMQSGPEMQFAPGGFYTDPPKKGDPYHVWSTDTMYTKDTGNKFNERYASANTQQNLLNPNDITRNYTRSGRLGELDYFSSPGGTDLSWSGPFGKKRHYMYSDNPLVGAAAEGFINPMVDRASGANPFSTNPYSNLKRFISTGNSQGIYGNGGLVRYDNGGPGNPPKEDPWQRYRQNELGYQNRVYSYQTDPEWFNSHANVWESGNSKNDEKWNEIVKNRVYAGTHGFNPVTGELVRLDAKADVPVATQEKATKDYAKKSYQERMTSNTPAGEENRKAVVAQGMKDMVQNPVLYAPGAVAAATLAGPSVIPAIGEALSYPAVIGSTTLPGITAGNMIGLGGGLYSANMLGNDLNTGYYGSDAPLIDRITRGLETGLGIIGSPGVIEGIGAGFNQGAKLFKGLGNIGRITRNNRPATTSKSLDEITSEVNALADDLETGIIPSRSEATADDMQSLLDRLTGIRKGLEEHIDPDDLNFNLDDIKGLNDYEKLKNQARNIEKELQRIGPTKGPEQPTFYTNDEFSTKLNQQNEYNKAKDYFDRMYPPDFAETMLNALFGGGDDLAREESFKNLFPNVIKPSWDDIDKIYTPGQGNVLRKMLKNDDSSPFHFSRNAVSPTRLKSFADDVVSGGSMGTHQRRLLDIQNEVIDPTSWLNRNPKDYVMEFKNMAGLSADEIEKLNDTQLRDLAYDIVRKRMDSMMDAILNEERMNKGKGVTVNLPPESLNRYGGSISSKNTYAYGGSANPFAYNPLQRYVYGTGGSAQKRKVRIVSLPTYGVGGPKTKKDTYDYVQEWVQKYIEAANAKKFQKWIPPTITDPTLRTRYLAQKPRRKDFLIYGDPEVETNWEEFKQRHAWYFKDMLSKPNMTIEEFTKPNPKDPKEAPEVKAFQRAYNAKAAEYGLPEYFDESGKGVQGTKVDGQYGEHTYSAPSFNKYVEPEVEPEPEPEPEDESYTIPTGDLDVTAPETPYSWFPQDMINLGVAAATQIPNIRTNYDPLKFRAPDYATIRENYSPIIAAQRVATEGANAYAAKPAAFAMQSALAGKTAAEAARHNEEVAKINAGKYDLWSAAVASVDNENSKYNSLIRQADYDARQLYAKDRIMARNKKMGTIAAAINAGLTNAAEIYNLNSMNENYQIDPRTGGLVTFVNPKLLVGDKNALLNARLREFQMWQDNTDLSDEQIVQLMRAKDAGMYSDMNSYINPYEMYAPGLISQGLPDDDE